MPSNQEIITAVDKWQLTGFFHPLTCGNSSNHKPLKAVEVDGKVVLKCLDCNYVQNWIPGVVTEQHKDKT